MEIIISCDYYGYSLFKFTHIRENEIIINLFDTNSINITKHWCNINGGLNSNFSIKLNRT